MDKQLKNIVITNISPVEIKGKKWFCIGFEPKDHPMGDAFNILLLHLPAALEGIDLLESITSALQDTTPLLRVHSECILGDVFHSDLCDCGEQLRHALSTIQDDGCGMIMYLRQEGRGIGLRAKLACLAVQEGYVAGKRVAEKLSPDAANLYFGYKVDERDYAIAGEILTALGIQKVRMLTGNLDKIDAIKQGGVEVISISDISRAHIPANSRKYRELKEKLSRNYIYSDLVKNHEK